MKKYLLLHCFIIITAATSAQQDPLYSQYINNPLVLNPAVAGVSANFVANVSYRKQWNDLPGSPTTFNANAQMSVLRNTAGAGVMFVSDNIGSTSVTEGYAMGSYHLKLDNDKILSFGIQAGFVNYRLTNDNLSVYSTTDPYFQGTTSKVVPSFGAGLFLKAPTFVFGISVPRMLNTNPTIDGSRFALYNQHLYVSGAYYFDLMPRIVLKPAALFKAVQGAPMSLDFNTSVIFDQKYQIGVLTRNLTTYGLFGRAQLGNQLIFGFVYEVPTSQSVGTNFTTYEFTLGFRMQALKYHRVESDF